MHGLDTFVSKLDIVCSSLTNIYLAFKPFPLFKQCKLKKLMSFHKFYVDLSFPQWNNCPCLFSVFFFLIMMFLNKSFVVSFLAGLPRTRCALGTEPNTHGIWSTSFRLVVT